jgi:D-glycero-alpha-D-manno-heptose 1-phosphate guanylyltransferase
MQVKEAIILAGGLGTRLRSAVPDLPKCMAPVAGRPFLSHVIDQLRMQGIEQFIFSLGYKAEVIEAFLASHYPTLQYKTVVEEEPLGTGGGILLACKEATSNPVAIANGDTLFKVDVSTISLLHHQQNAECTLALKPMQNIDRYGVVEMNETNCIQTFKEKQFYKEGLINGGVYLLNTTLFLQRLLPKKFSFEKDYLEKYVHQSNFYGCLQQGYFIDIGIPEDYNRAQIDLQRPALDLTKIDKHWTLFLDRDGVINEERVGDYVRHWDQFIFTKGTLDALKTLKKKFGRIIIVSNQRGVEKQLMTEEDLQHIHTEMVKKIEAAGGNVDKIYYCTAKDSTHFYRKPNPGMAYRALNDFNDIESSKTIMVGNKSSDMRFGRSAGMFTVFLPTTNPEQPYPHPDIDLRFESLYEFATAL